MDVFEGRTLRETHYEATREESVARAARPGFRATGSREERTGGSLSSDPRGTDGARGSSLRSAKSNRCAVRCFTESNDRRGLKSEGRKTVP